MIFEHFPYTNFHDINLDWILRTLHDMEGELNEFVFLNTIKYADPIRWNITTQYAKNTIVIDPETGDAYISVQAVPSGALLSNTDYWTVIFNYQAVINRIKENITFDAGGSSTTPVPLYTGDLVWWNDDLYEVLYDIPAGTAFIIGTNVQRCTVNDKLMGFIQSVQDEETARIAADDALQDAIDNEVTARTDADTALQDADTALQQAIDDEEAARIAADEDLRSEIETAGIGLGNINADLEFKYRRAIGTAPQAGTYTKDGFFVASGINTSTEAGYFYRFNIDDPTIAPNSRSIANAGHVNGMCYFPGHDSILFAIGWLSDGVPLSTLVELDASTLVELQRYNYTEYVTGVGSYDGDVWIFSNYTNHATLLNADLTESDTVITLQQPAQLTGSNAVRQTIGVYKDYIVEVYSSPALLVFYSKETGELVGYVNIKDMANALYWVGEIENVSFVGDDFYINSASSILNYNSSSGTQNIIGVFKGNIKKNAITNPYAGGIQTINNPIRYYHLYCDASAPASGAPDGTQANPFKYVQEAINAAMSSDVGSILITLLTAGSYGSGNISGLGKYIQFTGDAGARIPGLKVSDANIDIRNIEVSRIDAYRSTVLINGGKITNISGENHAILANSASRVHLGSGSVTTTADDYAINASGGSIVTKGQGFTWTGAKRVFVTGGAIYAPGDGDITGCAGGGATGNGILFNKNA